MDFYRRTFSRTIPIDHLAELRVENRNGKTQVRAHDRDEIVIKAITEFWAASPEDAERYVEGLARGIKVEGNTVEVRTPEYPGLDLDVDEDVAVNVSPTSWSRAGRLPFSIPWAWFSGPLFQGWHRPNVDYEISAPRDTVLIARARNGDIESAGIRGPADLETRNGSISVGDALGAIMATSRNGLISVARCSTDVTVKGSNSHVAIEGVAGPISVETRNGAIEITDAGASVQAVTANGSIRYRGSVHADFSLKTTNGSVTLDVPPDSRFEIDAESGFGSVRSDLNVREQPGEDRADIPRVRIRTALGGIRVREL